MFMIPCDGSRAKDGGGVDRYDLPSRFPVHQPVRPGKVRFVGQSVNAGVSLAILCPITSQEKGYPFEVALPSGGAVAGVILSDQVKSLDWRAHRAERIEPLPPQVTEEVLQKLGTLLG